MASTGAAAMKFVVLYCCCLAIFITSALADEESQFLDDINQYRISQGLPAFKENSGAECVAEQVAEKFRGTPCSNTTGTATVDGMEVQLDESLLSKCKLQLVNVKDGFMGPTCVPAGTSAANAPKLAANNVTTSPAYLEYLNDTKFISAGAGSVDNAWFVLVLGTNTSEGSYQNVDLDPSSSASLAFGVALGPVSLLAYLVSTFFLA